MIEKSFIDTNIFIYAFENNDSPKKVEAIKTITKENSYHITSVQVLNEFISATTKKKLLSKKQSIEVALMIKEEFEIVPLNHTVFEKAMEIYGGKKILVSLWDSLIIASALVNKCTKEYSEDMQHEFPIDGLIILNPFLLQ